MGKYNDVTRGQVEGLLNKIGGEEGMNAILSGRATIAYNEHVIDLDADPLIPYAGWKVEEHKKGGLFKWDPTKVSLLLHDKQSTTNGGDLKKNELHKELIDKSAYNANLLDYLLNNPHLIPEEWKEKRRIFFWGTVYRLSVASLWVRHLVWEGGHWREGHTALCEIIFDNLNPTAVATS